MACCPFLVLEDDDGGSSGFQNMGATFVFVLTGERCPSGGFGGW